MRRQFKSKKRYNNKIFFWIFLFFLTVGVNLAFMDSVSFSNIYTGDKAVINFKIDKKKLLLKLGLNYSEKSKNLRTDLPVLNEIEESVRKKIYIYNTHQTEEYKDYDVLSGAKYLSELLQNNGFEVFVEMTNIKDVLNKKDWTYKDSYKVTRELLNNMIEDEYDLYIDFHRDSSKRETSTVSIDKKNYARLMFVVGGKHETYTNNYQLSEDLNKHLKNFNNKISRGIYVRKSSSYNQDLDANVILIEVGGPENTREEVNNSLHVLSDVLKNYYYE